MTELESYIHSYFKVFPDELTVISSLFEQTRLKKGRYFLKPGQICNKLSFHKSGYMRVFHPRGDKEITQWISYKGFFITDLRGIHFNQPSPYYMQALTDCEFYTINREDYKSLADRLPRWHEIEKLCIASYFTVMEDRVFNLLSMSASERYQHLLSEHPELFNQVPLQYLASMLGMSPETLSRLRKNTT